VKISQKSSARAAKRPADKVVRDIRRAPLSQTI
jgi:hypothetical protein